ncbi:sugar ABC transporter ATP-binding protein [Paralcaligenes ureilyticus]|uniref:Ribose transport system ATP-binding protein n=1 Tax=Paralcaligenes ureilyticus TaxID=627131 RepID=A0A4R3MA16_9BURK|nr:sugar ABC transporter ATP-binding protein [Paralcaligenes ureilyticus]TCT09099.1 ribose transport system ATP-binding protein [Paralcaligenes ureilyticus]
MGTPPMNQNASALRLTHVSKEFGPVKAVIDVSLEIRQGRVHALLGENGAGKSTTLKLLSGLLMPSSGSIEVFGHEQTLDSPTVAQSLGIQTAFQEMTMLPDLSVLDNMLLPRALTGRTGMLQRSVLKKSIAQHFEELDFDLPLNLPVGRLDLAIQQKIEIARAVYRNPKILLLDEPTSTLSSSDVVWLGGIIENLKRKGVTVIFISHRMREVREFCDDLSILRNGAHVSTRPVSDYSDDEVIELIVGRSISQVYPKKDGLAIDQSKVVLELQDINAGKLSNLNIGLHKGEILGIAALQGMGQLDVFEICFGIQQPESGALLIDGQDVALFSPKDAIRSNVGIGFVPEDRKTEGLLLNQSGLKNASLPVLQRFKKRGYIDQADEAQSGAKVFDRIELSRRALWMDASSFSGGNQQKIVIAKWLLANSRILLLFDPARGIDIGTKHELYQLMVNFTKLGGSVLFYSTEISEVVNMSDRVHVMYRGKINKTLDGADITETNIMEAAMGDAKERKGLDS